MNKLTNASRGNASTIVDESWKGTYKLGGVCLFLTWVFFIIGFVLTIAQGPPPVAIEEILSSIGRQKLLYQTTNWVFVLSDLVPIPAMLALYLALKEIKRTHALVATAIGLLGVSMAIILRLGVHTMGILGAGYLAASSEAQRAGYVFAAELINGATDPGLYLANRLLFGWTLIISIAMLEGVFGKGAAYLGIVTGIIGIAAMIGVFVPALAMIGLFGSIGWIIWWPMIGFKLYKLG
jgi:hypothetical protein